MANTVSGIAAVDVRCLYFSYHMLGRAYSNYTSITLFIIFSCYPVHSGDTNCSPPVNISLTRELSLSHSLCPYKEKVMGAHSRKNVADHIQLYRHSNITSSPVPVISANESIEFHMAAKSTDSKPEFMLNFFIALIKSFAAIFCSSIQHPTQEHTFNYLLNFLSKFLQSVISLCFFFFLPFY